MFFSQNIFPETFVVDGKEYVLEEKKSSFKCPNFNIESLEKRLPSFLNGNLVRGGLGHLGDFKIISHKITYSNSSESISRRLPKLEGLLSSYERIDSSRPYISKPTACPGKDGVLFEMWGGGNCSTVCEAWALVIFSNDGSIKKIKGLSYDEYDNCSNYKCPAYNKLKNM